MYIDKTFAQRIIYLVVALYIVTITMFGIIELPARDEPNEEVVEQPVVYIVYVSDDSIPEETVEYYDVPLSEGLQDYIFELCEERDIDPALIIAMIRYESNFNADAKGDGGNSLGLMQIQPRWHQARMDEYDCQDLLDPYQNVTIGIDIIGDWLDGGNGLEYALMGYNGGGAYANRMAADGRVSDYAKNVITYTNELNETKEEL